MEKETINSDVLKEPEIKPRPTDSKKKYEFLWRFILILISIVSAVLVKKVYLFQTDPHFDDIRKGTVLDLLLYSLPFSVVFTLFDLAVHYYFDELCAKYYITLDRYTEPEQKMKRSYTLVKWLYSLLYYIASSVWAYKIMTETSYFPTWLGGKGHPMQLFDSLPYFPEATFEMKVFYILQFGKHFSRFFSHVFIRNEGNFYEYALHHGLSVFLIGFSYLTNQWLIGIFVLLLHDWSDFALILARVYKDCRYCSKKVLDVIYINAFTSWVLCRIVFFFYFCVFTLAYLIVTVAQNKLNQIEMEALYIPLVFMNFMLFSLQILHLFWTYYIAESFVAIKISTKLAKHTYD